MVFFGHGRDRLEFLSSIKRPGQPHLQLGWSVRMIVAGLPPLSFSPRENNVCQVSIANKEKPECNSRVEDCRRKKHAFEDALDLPRTRRYHDP